jgi:hypothetical protein
MIVGFVAYAFKDGMENGGHGNKIGLYRAHAAKTAAQKAAS